MARTMIPLRLESFPICLMACSLRVAPSNTLVINSRPVAENKPLSISLAISRVLITLASTSVFTISAVAVSLEKNDSKLE